MANTTSIKFPNMFNISQNRVAVLEDREAVANRTKLLILTEPTELYNNPLFGVGLRRHLYKYNTDTEKAIIRDRTVDQLKLHEPYCIPEETEWAKGLMFTGDSNDVTQKINDLEMTMSIKTTFNDTVDIDLSDV